MRHIFGTIILAVLAMPSIGWASDTSIGERVKVLLLTYNWPEEHNVMQSLLCLTPCTKDNDCPEEVLKYQKHAELPEVFWNDEFVVVRPIKIGQPQEVVDEFMGFSPDFISMSGHHSSGFSGENGSFALESLNVYSSGKELATVFGSASLVMLNGCNTEVQSNFIGDPFSYIQHIIQDTEVREDDLPRLRAAISQISGIQKSYRHIYPNACIMGYQGTSVPGGIPQIYGQYANTLRAIYKINEGKELPPRLSLLSGGTYSKNEQKVFNECPAKQWPCNLCKKDSKYYSTLYKSLAKYLRNERNRQSENRSYSPVEVDGLESLFDGNRFYPNSKWACSEFSPETLPVLPEKDKLPKSGKLLLDILFTPASQSFTARQAIELQEELLHQLAYIRFRDEELDELRALFRQEEYQKKMLTLRNQNLSLRGLSDYYNISQKFLCDTCLEGINTKAGYTEASIEDRTAFARSLDPSFGQTPYRLVLGDTDTQIAEEGARKLNPSLGDDLYLLALDKGTDVGLAAISSLNWSERVGPKVIIQALNSQDTEVRRETWWRVDSDSPDEVLITALKSPHKNEFSSAEFKIGENHSSEVIFYGLQLPEASQRIQVGKKIRSKHDDRVFNLALNFKGEEVEIARNAAERLSQSHSVAVYEVALKSSDYFVRSGAVRRLEEKREPSLYALALGDRDQRIQWAASGSLNRSSGENNYRTALDSKQHFVTRRNAASRLYPGINQTIIDLAVNDSDKDVRNAAKEALEVGE